MSDGTPRAASCARPRRGVEPGCQALIAPRRPRGAARLPLDADRVRSRHQEHGIPTAAVAVEPETHYGDPEFKRMNQDAVLDD